jgi:putative inorganic carbon (HCO3(-)) transporter
MSAFTGTQPRTFDRPGAVLLIALLAIGLGLAASSGSVLVLLAAIGVLVLLACLHRPDAATLLVIAALYSNAAAVAIRDHNMPVVVGYAFPAPLLLPLAYYLLIKRRPVVLSPALPFLIVYLLAMLLGGATSRDAEIAFEQVFEFITTGLIVFIIVTNVLRTESAVRAATWTVVLVGAGLSTLVVYQFVTSSFGAEFFGFAQVNFPGRAGSIFSIGDGLVRLSGPIGEVNRFAQVLVVLVPLGAMLAASSPTWQLKGLALGSMVMTLAGVATTGSRGAAFAVVVLMAAFFLLGHLRLRHLALVAVLGIGLLAAFPSYGERLLSLQALGQLSVDAAAGPAQGDVGNLRSRATETLAALLVFTDHPIAGVGAGQFPTYYQEYAREVSSPLIDTRIDLGTREAHNLFTDILAETGIVGFFGFVGATVTVVAALLRSRTRWKSERPGLSQLATGYALALLAYASSGMFLHLSYERFYWILLALAAALAIVALRPTGPDEEPDQPLVHSFAIDDARWSREGAQAAAVSPAAPTSTRGAPRST